MLKKEFHLNRRLVIIILAGLVILAALLGVCLGAVNVSPIDFIDALINGETTRMAYRIVMHVRLPRVLGGLLAGSALAVSGCILQSLLQNPLASPNVIGINGGAGVCVLICASFFPAAFAMYPMVAFLGALLTAILVYLIAMGSRSSKVTLILTGIAVSSITGAGMNFILTINPDAYVGASDFLIGGLSGLTMKALQFVWIYILIGMICAFMLRRELNLIRLGQDTAKSLGLNVPVVRFLLLVSAALLAGAAISFAGMIGFVGLIIPHAMRFIIGHDNEYLVPASALAGAAFVILCDLVSRTAFAPYELPVGILLAFIGGPFFIYLVVRYRKAKRD